MKKILSMLCVVLVVGFAGKAFAGKMEKEDVCHNGSVYTGNIGAVDEPNLWVFGFFVINISGNAVQKHIDNHGDSVSFSTGDPVITELVSVVNGIVIDVEEQDSCVPE